MQRSETTAFRPEKVGIKDSEKGKGARGDWGMSKTDSAYTVDVLFL